MFRFLPLVTFYRIGILVSLPEGAKKKKKQNVRFLGNKLVCKERCFI